MDELTLANQAYQEWRMAQTQRSYRSPQDIIDEASEKATKLKEIVERTKISKMIGEKEHLQIEAWMTIGSFYGCTARSSVQPIEINGVYGFKAHGQVTVDASGAVVSEADAYCMEDEDGWDEKDMFQRASMAQTRSMSKALANKFRWVVVLAGYATTPAEEMNGKIGSSAYQLKIPFGDHKGKTPKDLTTEQLCQEQARFQELADDPTNKYRDNNRKLVEAIKAELATRPVEAPRTPLTQATAKGDANLFEGYCSRMRASKDPLVIREEQRLGATDQRLSIDQMTAVNDLAVELLARKK